MKRFRYYLKLYWLSVSRAFMTEMQYRANFLMTVLSSLAAFATTLIFFNVVYFRVKSLAGWSHDEFLLLLGVYLLMRGVFDATIRKGLDRLPRHIRNGSFDKKLTHPASPLFQTSFNRLDFDDLSQIVLAFLVLTTAAHSLSLTLDWLRLGSFILLVLSGLTILYANYLLLMSTSFWLIRQEHQEIYVNFLQMGRIPLDVYSKRTQFIFTFIIPLAFIVLFPAQALLGRLSSIFLLVAPIFAAINLYLSIRFWHFALRHYSSVSS